MAMGVPRYVSQSTLARRFGVTRSAFANWRQRYPPESDRLPTPAPDAYVGDRPLWLEDSIESWEAWLEARPEWRADRVRGRRVRVKLGPRPDSARARIIAAVRDRIDEGVYQVGEPLPPLETLAEEHGVTTMTAQRAMQVLQEDGVVARAGKRLVVRRRNSTRLSPPQCYRSCSMFRWM